MSNIERRTIVDEFGELTQRMSARGKWVNETRTVNEITFNVDGKKKTDDYMRAVVSMPCKIRLNILNDRAEIKGDHKDLPNKWEPMSDVYHAAISNHVLDVGMTGRDRINDAMTTFSYRNRYHPIKEFFENTTWDGEDHLSNMLSHFTFDEKSKEWGNVFFRKWMIGAIAKVYEQAQNFMLVLDGKQGLGKSFWARWLCPLPRLFLESPLNPDDKDSYLRLASYWLWEVGELGATTRKADRDAMKDFITRREVTMRKPYGRHDIIKNATASLVGTINEDGAGFLNDRTGNRRFAVCCIEEIDRNYSTIDSSQLWAQIYSIYKSGESWHLDDDAKEAQIKLQESYETMSAVDQYLWQSFEISGDGWISSADILATLKDSGINGNDRSNLMELSGVLKSKGCKKVKRKNRWGFSGVAYLGKQLN